MIKKTSKKFSNASGYIALVSALIISAIIVVVVVALGQISFLHRINIANSYFKERSRELSKACVETALLKLAQNPSYAGNETINVASDTCQIVSVVSGAGGRVVSSRAQFQNSFTDYKVAVATGAVSVLGWEEVPHF